MSFRWFSRKAFQVGDGGLRCRGMYFATVEMATSMPSFASSLRMRGAPQVTFACDILRIRLTTSRSSLGRPRRPGLLFRLQKRLKPMEGVSAGWRFRQAQVKNAKMSGDQAVVEYDPTKVTPQALADAVEKTG